MTLWTNSYDRRSDRRYDPTGHLMTVKTTVDSTGGPIVRLILFVYIRYLFFIIIIVLCHFVCFKQ